MEIQNIQRKDEKIIFGLACVFSGIVWGLVALSLLFVFSRPLTPDAFCVYTYEDEEFETEYYYVSMDEAYAEGYEDYCLPQDEVPVETWTTATEEFAGLAFAERMGFIAGALVMFFYIGLFLFFFYAMTALMMAIIRLNGVHLSKEQHPELYALYEKAAQKLGLTKIPAAYVIDGDGIANAFAVKIARKRMVVFYAELVDRMLSENKETELLAIAGHELTHVKLRHIQYWAFLLPFSMIPLIYKHYSRLRELSADRGAYFVTNDIDAVSNALVKLVIGVRMSKGLNEEEYIKNSETERGFFVTLARLLMTHPSIPHRIRTLQEISE